MNYQGHIPSSRRTYVTRLITIGLTVTLGFSAVSAYILWEERNRDREAARLTAANLVQTISSEIDRNLELYDLSLQAVVEALSQPELSKLSPEMRRLVMFDRAASAKGMGSIFILDKNGNVTTDSRTATPPIANFASSDFFRVHEARLNTAPYLSTVWRDANGEQLIGLTRRLSASDGSFAGVVVGTLRLSYIREMFKKLKLGDKHALALVRTDGSVIIRDPHDERLAGNMRASPVFRKITAHLSGSFEETATSDGVVRLYVFQEIGDQSLILFYGQSLESVYADWRHKAWRIGALMLVLGAVNIALVVFLARTIKRRSNAEHQLAILATTDSLTGLCNRRRLDELFDSEWRRAMRSQSSCALLMIDADHFKDFNDQFGHQAGDDALVAIAHCVMNSARRGEDVAARYGGEEFAVLLPGTTLIDAMTLAEGIRGRVMALRADQQNRSDATPTVSIGVACMIPRQGLLPRDLIKAADTGLYRAKNNGRNRVEPTPTLTEVWTNAA